MCASHVGCKVILLVETEGGKDSVRFSNDKCIRSGRIPANISIYPTLLLSRLARETVPPCPDFPGRFASCSAPVGENLRPVTILSYIAGTGLSVAGPVFCMSVLTGYYNMFRCSPCCPRSLSRGISCKSILLSASFCNCENSLLKLPRRARYFLTAVNFYFARDHSHIL